jgi:hypothetical protein
MVSFCSLVFISDLTLRLGKQEYRRARNITGHRKKAARRPWEDSFEPV